MECLSRSIASLGENHISQFKNTEKKIIENIREGKRACLFELQKVSLREEIIELENVISNKLTCVQQEILKNKEKKEKFDEMDVYRKLCSPKVLNSSEEKNVPSLGPLYKLVLKLQAEVNYKAAIKKHHISF